MSPRELVAIFDRAKGGMVGVFLLVLGAACAYALFTKPIYRAQVVMVPAEKSDSAGLASLVGQFGGLAALAGVNLGSSGSELDEALAVIKSRSFTERFIRERNLLPILFAKKWDAEAKRWKVDDPDKAPTLGDGVDKFNKQVRRVGHDEGSSIVTLSVDWHDRKLAVEWANALVADLNEEMRRRAKDEATRSVAYLNATASRASEVAIREAAYRLVEAQFKTIMLADVRGEYAFRVLDPATVPDADKYIWPKRLLIVAAAFLLAGLLAMIYALLLDAIRRFKEQVAA